MVLLDTGTPGASREIYSECANGKTRTGNNFSNVIDFSSEKYNGSTGNRNSLYKYRNLQ